MDSFTYYYYAGIFLLFRGNKRNPYTESHRGLLCIYPKLYCELHYANVDQIFHRLNFLVVLCFDDTAAILVMREVVLTTSPTMMFVIDVFLFEHPF